MNALQKGLGRNGKDTPMPTPGGYASREHAVDFTRPAGEPALVPASSISWRIFKNPIALFVGGVTAVLLELAEPRVRSGVWDHTMFRLDPIPRMKRTGLAAMVTVYGPHSTAEKMIAGIRRMHQRVRGTTPAGEAYHANDPVLLDWVQATASFGFLEAYSSFVHAIGDEDKDRLYTEAEPAARLYGAVGAPTSLAALHALFDAMRPRLERSEIVFEFLEIMQRAPIMPWPFWPFQRMLVRAGVEITPDWVRDILELGAAWRLRPWERAIVSLVGRMSDHVILPFSPPAQACRRLGLPRSYLTAARS